MLPKIQTGCVSVDKALGSGLPCESVTLIYGEAETGKTTLAMQCAVNCALQGYKTLFVDCDGTFSARRLSQITAKRLEVAEMIILMKPEGFREQTVVIDRLAEYATKNFGLIVIDTIASLYSLGIAEHPEKTFELNRELNRQIASLAQLSRTQKIAVLITSQVRDVFTNFNAEVEPVATRVVRFWADTIIMMKPTERPAIVRAILEKCPRAITPLGFDLRISEKGMEDYSIH